MTDNIKIDIISAQNDGDWKRCIRLCRKALDGNTLSSASELYGLKISLAFALLNDEKNIKDGCEEAINIYKGLLLRERRDTSRWSQLQKNLGYAYAVRINDDKDKNLLKSIMHYGKSLASYKKIRDKKTWASIKAEIGYAYMGLRKGSMAQNAIEASNNFKEALEVFNKSEYQVEWLEITDSLKICKERIKREVKE